MSKSKHSWSGLFWVQFLGVFNDNFIKGLIVFLSVNWSSRLQKDTVLTIASAAFMVPFILFSPIAGTLTCFFEKKRVVQVAKASELLIVSLAVFTFSGKHLWSAIVVVFLMGLHSALYGPSKYSLISDIGGERGLSFGNGTMEMLSFLAIVLGTVTAGLVADARVHQIGLLAGVALFFAVAGFIASLTIRVPELPVHSKAKIIDWNPIAFLRDSYRYCSQFRGLNASIFGASAFWMIGAMLQLNLALHCPGALQMSITQTSLTQALLAVGIGVGCFGASLLSFNVIELSFLPIGGFGLACALLAVAFIPQSSLSFTLILGAGVFMSGFYKVPLSAWIQGRAAGEKIGLVLAYLNLVNFIGIIMGSFFLFLASHFIPQFSHFSVAGANTHAVFAFSGILMLIATVVTLFLIPQVFVRFFVRILFSLFFKMRVTGAENIPAFGGALLVCNHVSLIDPAFIVAAVPRGIRFVMLREMFVKKSLHWFYRYMRVIPVPVSGSKKSFLEFIEKTREALKRGQLVCIFAEAELTRHGHLLPFKRGYEHIIHGLDVPVIPVAIDGLWRGPWSSPGGVNQGFRLSHLFLRVSLAFGPRLNCSVSQYELQEKVREMQVHAMAETLRSQHGEHLNEVILERESLSRLLDAPLSCVELPGFGKSVLVNSPDFSGVDIVGLKLFQQGNWPNTDGVPAPGYALRTNEQGELEVMSAIAPGEWKHTSFRASQKFEKGTSWLLTR